jgi:hypothetical protein
MILLMEMIREMIHLGGDSPISSENDFEIPRPGSNPTSIFNHFLPFFQIRFVLNLSMHYVTFTDCHVGNVNQ